MDIIYFAKLLLSMLFFAPGILVLAVCTFLALAMTLEKLGVLGRKDANECRGRTSQRNTQEPSGNSH
jgi:hypothetical protein